jgi:type IV secretory pathway TrbD component
VSERRSPVYKAINKPLLLMGCDRRLFFAAVVIGTAIWNMLNTLIAALLTTVVMILVARFITATDPQLPRILLNSAKFAPEYDVMKFADRK